MSKDKGSGTQLNIGIDATGAEVGAQKAEKALNKVSKSAKKTDVSMKKAETSITKAQKSMRQLASSIAVVDGPLGGVASRFNAFGTLLGRVNPNMIGFAVASLAVGTALKKTIGVFVPYEQGMLRLEAVLEATGRQSEVTADQIDDLAIRIGKDTLTSRQAVLDAASSLATFGEIGSESFERVLITAQDLSATFGGNLKSNVQLLARALQSPAEAFTVLERRIGKFSSREKDLLKVLVESGEIATAQEILFAKLASVQGAAVAEAGKLSGAFDTLGEDIANLSVDFAESINLSDGLTTAVKSLSTAVKSVPKLVDAFSRSMDRLATVMRPFDALLNAVTRDVIKMGDAMAENLSDENLASIGRQTISFANSIGILGNEAAQSAAGIFKIDSATGKFKEVSESAAAALNKSLIPAVDTLTAAEEKQASATEKANEFLKEQDDRLDSLVANAERLEISKKFREELEKIAGVQSFELQAFGLEGSDLQLLELETKIRANQQAFDDLGESGRVTFEKIQQDIVSLGELQKQQDLTQPITDYVDAAEFGLKKINDLIVSSAETTLDALVDPYRAGETAAERWKNVVANILREVSKEIIRTQIIARAVGFAGALAGGAFSGPTAPRGAGGIPLPVARPSAKGNAFSNGKIIPHANGGIVDRAGAFPMAGGNIGTIAEGNKPEAILPLRRNSSGQLGVVSSGGGGSTSIKIDNNIVVNGGGGSREQDENLGRTIAKQIDAKINQSMTKFVLAQRKPGGAFNSGATA